MSGKSLETRMTKWSLQAADWTVIGGCFVVYVLDGVFFWEWAPSKNFIPLFLIVAIVLRTTSIALGIILEKSAGKIPKGTARFLRIVQIMFFAVCYLATMNFFVAAPDNKERTLDLAKAQGEATAVVNDARIEEWEAEIARLEGIRDLAIANSEGTKSTIALDAREGISTSDGQRLVELNAQSNSLFLEYEAQIKPWKDKIEAAKDQGTEAKVASQTSEHELTTWPVFNWIDERTFLSLEVITSTVMLIIVTALELWVTWGAPSIAKTRRHVERRLKEMVIEDRINEANDNAALKIADIEAQERIAALERDAKFAEAEAAAKHKALEQEHAAKQRASQLLADAENQIRLKEAEQQAEDMLSALEPEDERNYSPAQLNGAKGANARNFNDNSKIPLIIVPDLRPPA